VADYNLELIVGSILFTGFTLAVISTWYIETKRWNKYFKRDTNE